MKISIETRLWAHENNTIEFNLFFNDGIKILEIKELLDKELCEDKQIMKRLVDKMFYELKNQTYRHFALKEVL